MAFEKSEFILLNGKLGVVVGTAGDPDVPENHVAVWFGNTEKMDGIIAEVWTVPAEYCAKAPTPVIKH